MISFNRMLFLMLFSIFIFLMITGCNLDDEKHEDFRINIEKKYKSNTNNKEFLIQYLRVLSNEKKYHEEIIVIEKYLSKNKSDKNILSYLGLAKYYIGEYNSAIEIYESLFLNGYKKSSDLLYASLCYEKNKNFVKALEKMNERGNIYNKDPFYYLKIGDYYFKLNNKTKARELWIKSIDEYEKINGLIGNIDYIEKRKLNVSKEIILTIDEEALNNIIKAQ